MKQTLRVLFLAAEAEPMIKVGGLGDVAGSLPVALRSLASSSSSGLVVEQGSSPEIGLDIRLVIPLHAGIHRQGYDLHDDISFDVPYPGKVIRAQAFPIEVNGLPVYLVSGAPIPPDSPVYSPDAQVDGSKFTFFSLAALELARSLGWAPHVVHANDWHTAPAVYDLSRRRLPGSFFFKSASLLGVHNLPYLGIGAGAALIEAGLPPAVDSALPTWAQGLPLPLGLLGADHIVAVSPSYAQEILTSEFGAGLHEFLRSRAQSVTGILNGLDTRSWDPRTDQLLTANYHSSTLTMRSSNKICLQNKVGLSANPNLPLIGLVSRLDSQKGIDLIPDALYSLVDQPWQAVLLGSGDPALEDSLHRLEAELPDRVRAIIRYDSDLSHSIYAGADLLVIPSRYEPCGLTQMIAMRYGCVPVGRAVGGLKDTILDYNGSIAGTGFLFDQASSAALSAALRHTFQVYPNQAAWQDMQRRGMSQDFSWNRSAHQYLDLYRDIISRRSLVCQSKGAL
jgi:starch synthase